MLIISFFFPPQNVIASLRIGKLAKYLDRNGIDPWVLTVKDDLVSTAGQLDVEIDETKIVRADFGSIISPLAKRRCQSKSVKTYDSAAVSQISKPSSIRRLISWAGGHLNDVRFPDRALPWIIPAIRAGANILNRETIDVIVSSHGPPSTHLVACSLAKRFNVPWIADYRDLWTQNHVLTRTGISNWVESHFEQRVLRFATHITTVSEPLAEELRRFHGKPVTVITNGFDHEDYNNVPLDECSEKFRIAYTGMINPGKRDPTKMFHAVRHLVDNYQELSERLELHFYGTNPASITPIAEAAGISKHVYCHPRTTPQETIRQQCAADVLLLLEWEDVAARGVFTGKFFEYIGAKRPILAFSYSDGVIAHAINTTGAGRNCSNFEDAVEFIKECWNRKVSLGTTRLNLPTESTEPFTREFQAKELAKLIQKVARVRKTSET